jgi:DnaD/phage-associated family protein
MPFPGFPPGKVLLVPVPAPFFTRLLPEIDHLGELKVVLYAFWRLSQAEGRYRYLTQADFLADERFMEGLSPQAVRRVAVLQEALTRAVARGIFLQETVTLDDNEAVALYFLNTPKGRAAADAVRAGHWRPASNPAAPAHLYLERPNIFRLYEEHIGPITPLLAEQLEEAEAAYPYVWLEDAFRIAVANNARNWRYVEAILKRWHKEGRHDPTTGGDSEKDRRRYLDDKFADFYE